MKITDQNLVSFVIQVVDRVMHDMMVRTVKAEMGLNPNCWNEWEIDSSRRSRANALVNEMLKSFPSFIKDIFDKHFSRVESEDRLAAIDARIVENARRICAYDLEQNIREVVRSIAKEDAKRDFDGLIRPKLELLYALPPDKREAEIDRLIKQTQKSSRKVSMNEREEPRDWYDED